MVTAIFELKKWDRTQLVISLYLVFGIESALEASEGVELRNGQQ
jgi:hypothetical protein